MKILEIPLENCRNGDILAADIYNINGVVLASKDTVINDYIRDRLNAMGIDNIKIQYAEDLTQNAVNESYIESIKLIKEILNDLASGKKLSTDKILIASELIYSTIDKRECIIKSLREVLVSDEYTYTHSIQTAFYSMLIAKWLGLSKEDITKAIKAGLLHDIGKTKIPSEILNKQGKLTVQEYEQMKEHPLIGYKMLNEQGNDIDEEIKLAVLYHHERLDCSGYPLKASFQELNMLSKIIAVADVFDAMTSDRVYKKKISPFGVFEMFLTVGLSYFDTTVLNAFIKNIAPYYIGAKVLLSNGEIGEIVYIPPQDIAHPIIRFGDKFCDFSSKRNIEILEII